MHAAGGALVAGLGGGNALGGALGAGLTSKLGGVLDKVSDEIKAKSPTGNADLDQALGQIVATSLGTVAGAAVGGSSGAFTGFNTDRFNRQLHPDEKKWISDRGAAYAKRYGLTPQQAHNELTMQANLQVQNGSAGTWNQRASDFLAQAHGMLPADGANGPGYMFYATPEQKANVEIYAEHYPNRAGINIPGRQSIMDSANRDQAGRDELARRTIGAAQWAAAIAMGGPIAALRGIPIFSTNGKLGSATLASANGTGAISAAVTAGAQYAQNGSVNPAEVAAAYAVGAAGASGGLIRNVALNAVGAAATTSANNYLYDDDKSILESAIWSGLLSSLGYTSGKLTQSWIDASRKPTINSANQWIKTGYLSGSGWNLFRPNSVGVIGGTIGGGISQEAAGKIPQPFISEDKK